jgi:hypothetical protein
MMKFFSNWNIKKKHSFKKCNFCVWVLFIRLVSMEYSIMKNPNTKSMLGDSLSLKNSVLKKKFDFKNLKVKGRDFLVHSPDLWNNL